MAKILLYALEFVGKTMAGPSIRYWEFAKALSKKHQVILLIPNDPEEQPKEFTVLKRTPDYRKYFKQVDVIITMLVNQSMAWAAKKHGVKIILDVYDPMPFELLEIHHNDPMPVRVKEQNYMADLFNFSFRMADHIICASENQRDLWTGLLLSLNKITPAIYDNDKSLKNLIDIVPFGLAFNSPQKKGKGPKSLFKLKETDKFVLWGGSVGNWFDPLTLIKAIHLISLKRSDVHLVFMGVKAPSAFSQNSMGEMSTRAVQLAEKLGILNQYVHFNYEWVPYEERTSFLLEADIGISTHFDHLETRYSFRTRILDYIWAGLPIINTEGDFFSGLIHEKQIGLTVPYEDTQALADAIVLIIDNSRLADTMKRNLASLRREFQWDAVVEPIQNMIEQPLNKQSKITAMWQIISFIYRVRGPFFPFKILFNRIAQRLGFSKVR